MQFKSMLQIVSITNHIVAYSDLEDRIYTDINTKND